MTFFSSYIIRFTSLLFIIILNLSPNLNALSTARYQNDHCSSWIDTSNIHSFTTALVMRFGIGSKTPYPNNFYLLVVEAGISYDWIFAETSNTGMYILRPSVMINPLYRYFSLGLAFVNRFLPLLSAHLGLLYDLFPQRRYTILTDSQSALTRIERNSLLDPVALNLGIEINGFTETNGARAGIYYSRSFIDDVYTYGYGVRGDLHLINTTGRYSITVAFAYYF